uniref:Protein tramtrack, alpha isoform n=1 Tax=Cacopsylla melanoneura TaxID=428564 RepID=A0A8D8QDT3_9HEMI
MNNHGFEAPPIAHIPNLFRGKRITWNDEETKCLIRIAGKIMPTKMRKKQSREIYRTIAYQMNKRGYKKTFEQCRIKWKHLKHFYSVALSVSGIEEKLQVCPYYEELSNAIKDCKKYCAMKTANKDAGPSSQMIDGENSGALDYLPGHFILNQVNVSDDEEMDSSTKSMNNVCYKLNWKQGSPLSRLLPLYLNTEIFSDVSLVCEGQTLKCHKIILSCYSDYFKDIFLSNIKNSHPIIVINDKNFSDLKAVINFLYTGEVMVPKTQMSAFLDIAKSFCIKGLTDAPVTSQNYQDEITIVECPIEDYYYSNNGMDGSDSSVSDNDVDTTKNGVSFS